MVTGGENPQDYLDSLEGNLLPRISLQSKDRGELKGLNVLLSRTQAGPGRAVMQEQEENSRNQVQAF